MRLRVIIAGLVVGLSTLAILLGQNGKPAEGAFLPCTDQVSAGGNLQAAVRAATPGAVICLDAGWHVSRGLLLDSYTSPGITIRGAGTDKTVAASDGSIDAILIINTSGITLENMIIAGGLPSGLYVSNSQDIRLDNVIVGFNGIGLHFDSDATAQVTNSLVAGNRDDGILIRQRSVVTLTDNSVFANGGVGVSAVGHTGKVVLTRNQIADNRGPGFFAGQSPCALLPPGVLEAPACYFTDLPSFVGSSDVTIEDSTIRTSGSTGLVFFPGTTGILRRNEISSNLLTGLFVWGAKVDAYANVFSKNEEHAIEYRAFPDPLHFKKLAAGYPRRASGMISGNTIKDTVRLGSILGGGILSQGADMRVLKNEVRRNAGIGISFVNSAKGEIKSNVVTQNGGSAICLTADSSASVSSNVLFQNLVNKIGACAEASP
jgi:parallel beta-helix repeat protein